MNKDNTGCSENIVRWDCWRSFSWALIWRKELALQLSSRSTLVHLWFIHCLNFSRFYQANDRIIGLFVYAIFFFIFFYITNIIFYKASFFIINLFTPPSSLGSPHCLMNCTCAWRRDATTSTSVLLVYMCTARAWSAPRLQKNFPTFPSGNIFRTPCTSECLGHFTCFRKCPP